MANKEIKIFYSWQSDLRGNQTRNLIQDSISNAVKGLQDTVEVDADRDTKGEFGSPDIVQTIFSKIDECDLFIADVSVINKYTSIDENGNALDKIKTTPNPNVLLELGYAAKTLGWDRVICIINTDFGDVSELPFDIAHRRLTPYSLKSKSKSEIKKELTGIIVATVSDLVENGIAKRVKGQFAYHIIGSYDFAEKKVIEKLFPVTVSGLQMYEYWRQKTLIICKGLIHTISSIKLQSLQEVSKKENIESTISIQDNIMLDGKSFPLQKSDLVKMINSPRLVSIKSEDIQDVASKAKYLFNIDLMEDFFCMGNLQVTSSLLPIQESEYIGTDEEKEKYDKFQELLYHLHRLQLWDMYIQTFDDMVLIPLAISNISTSMDSDITVSIKVDEKTAEIVLPNEELFNKKINGFEEIIDEGIVENLFMMEEDNEIKYDSDISYEIAENQSRMSKENVLPLGCQSSYFTRSDYEMELKKYIASPRERSSSDFEFWINSLRPKENKWLGAAILVRPKQEKIKMFYSIKSRNSNGELSGTLECESEM